MIFDKKGISPLIATVLIIGLTVASAAVILIWGQGFQKGIQSEAEVESCINAKILHADMNPEYAGCYNGTRQNDTCVKYIAWEKCKGAG